MKRYTVITLAVLLAPLLLLEGRGRMEGGGWQHRPEFHNQNFDHFRPGAREDWQRNQEERNLLNYGEAAYQSGAYNTNNGYGDDGDIDDADETYEQDVQQMEQGEQQPQTINININEDQGGQ